MSCIQIQVFNTTNIFDMRFCRVNHLKFQLTFQFLSHFCSDVREESSRLWDSIRILSLSSLYFMVISGVSPNDIILCTLLNKTNSRWTTGTCEIYFSFQGVTSDRDGTYITARISCLDENSAGRIVGFCAVGELIL